MKEQSRNFSLLLHRASASKLPATALNYSSHGAISTLCQINTMDNKYKGKMIAVVYLEKGVCEAHDINSAFSVSNFTSKHAPNNEQGRA